VFTLGSSLGVAAAYGALHSDAVRGGILMGSPLVPGGPVLSRAAPLWRSEAVQAVLQLTGRAARLDCGILFNFDEDYGYSGAASRSASILEHLELRPGFVGHPVHVRAAHRARGEPETDPGRVW